MRTWRGCAARACPTSSPGKSELDLALALDILNRELGVKRLLLEGGGGANGAFLRAGLVDELNLILCPAVDGARGAPSVFDSTDAEVDRRAPVTAMTLETRLWKAAQCCCGTGSRTRIFRRQPVGDAPVWPDHIQITSSSSAQEPQA
jgi:riboflavin biosynthesis pyrimidine reductase